MLITAPCSKCRTEYRWLESELGSGKQLLCAGCVGATEEFRGYVLDIRKDGILVSGEYETTTAFLLADNPRDLPVVIGDAVQGVWNDDGQTYDIERIDGGE